MLLSQKIQRRQSEIREQLSVIAGVEKPNEEQRSELGALDSEYTTNEARYRAALIAEDTERRQADNAMGEGKVNEWSELVGKFELRQALLQLTDNKYIILLLINVLLLIVGCFLEPIASISILVPVLMPIILKVGIHPVHFGVVMTLNLMIGLLHPPLGMVLFVLSRIAKLSIERTTMAILPWLIPLMMSLIAITLIPELTLWLPRTMGMLK